MSSMKELPEEKIQKLADETGDDVVFLSMKASLEEKIQKLAEDTGYDVVFLMDMWRRMCAEAIADGVEPDWEQFCGITMEYDW